MHYKHSKNITSLNRVFARNSDCVRRKDVKTQVNRSSEKYISTASLQLSEPEVIQFSRQTPETSKKCIRSCRSGDHRTMFYGKMPPHLKELINQAHLENGTSEQIVLHLEKVLKVTALGTPDQLQINTVTQQAPQ